MEDPERGDSERDSGRSPPNRTALPLILLAAVIQGWVLYWLHNSLKFHHWPATDQAWLVPLYALALFIPGGARVCVAVRPVRDPLALHAGPGRRFLLFRMAFRRACIGRVVSLRR